MDDLAKPRVAPAPAVEADTKPTPPAEKILGDKIDSDLYVTYALDHDIPFVAEYYGVDNLINYKDLSYKEEVDAIDTYLVDEIRGKRLENTTEAVKKRLKQLEKIAGVSSLAPTSVRVKQLAAYSEYMKKMSDIGQSVKL